MKRYTIKFVPNGKEPIVREVTGTDDDAIDIAAELFEKYNTGHPNDRTRIDWEEIN